MPHAAGVIIAASVLVAASIAAYENPEIRAWIDRSSNKVAIAFKSLGEDIHGRGQRRRPSRQDSSMHEDVDEKAEERRRQARQEILERSKAMQDKKKRKRPAGDGERSPSFDSLVDDNGNLRPQVEAEANPWAASSSTEQRSTEGLRSRHQYPQMHESVDAPILLRQLNSEQRPGAVVPAIEPWESQYEQEMRNAWNIELPSRRTDAEVADSHASVSLIDLTPTTEDFPDPDYSVPSLADVPDPNSRPGYFSAAGSRDASLPDENAGQHLHPLTAIEPRPFSPLQNDSSVPSQYASLTGSTAHVGHSDAEFSDDDMSDEYGDGIRTPASAWTEIGSSVSGDERQ